MSSLSVRDARPRAPALGIGAARLTFVAILVAGVALRVSFSRAPLWNDEIWSLLNLREVSGLPGILWGLSHDNNHFLNSIWLWLVSPFTSDPTALRLVSPCRGRADDRRHGAPRRAPWRGGGAGGGGADRLLVLSGRLQRRGARLCASRSWRSCWPIREIEAERGSRLRLALACGVGFFAHLACGPGARLPRLRRFRRRRLRRNRGGAAAAFAATFRQFWPAALACLPTLGFLVAGYLNKGGFTIGALMPFSMAHAIGGFANLAMMTFGLDPTSFAQTVFTLVGLPLIGLAAIALLAPPERRVVYLVMLVILPLLALLLKIPNTHVGRYFFAASPFLILLAADSFGALIRRGGVAAALALAVLAATLVSDGAALARLARGEAKPWSEALDLVARSNAPTLASSHDFNVGKTIAWYNATRGAALDLAPPDRLCEAKPGWYVLETRGDGKAEEMLSLCATPYRLAGVFDEDVPSQLPWALYRRAE